MTWRVDAGAWVMRRSDVVAANISILNSRNEASAPVLKAVELATRARCADNTDILHTISAASRIATASTLDSGDPFYQQWVYTKALVRAVGAERLDMVQFLTAHFAGCFMTLAVKEATRHGHLSILQWFRDHQDNVKWGGNELCTALRSNHLEVAQWLHEDVPRPRYSGSWKSPAAASGSIDVLWWAFEVDDPRISYEFLQVSVNTCNLEMVKWMIESGRVRRGDSPLVLLDDVASKGHLDMIQWLLDRRIGGFSPYCAEKAGANGHYDVVVWLMQNRADSWSDTSPSEITGHSRLEIVRCVAEDHKGCLSSRAMDLTAKNGRLDVVTYLHEQELDCTTAAMNGLLGVIQWLHTHLLEGCTSYAMNLAADNGYLDVVKWLHENRSEGCTACAIDGAAGEGHMDIVKWLHANRTEGCTLNAIIPASQAGHLDAIMWFYQHCDSEHSEKTPRCAVDWAAGRGRLETARWLVATYNVQCSDAAMDAAAEKGHLPMVVLLRSEFGGRCSSGTFVDTATANELEIVQWLFHHFLEEVDADMPIFHTEARAFSPCLQNWLFGEAGPLSCA